MRTNYDLPASVRARLAGTQVGNWQTRGSRGSTVSFGVKCRRCREYLPSSFVNERGVCNICRAEMVNLGDPDELRRYEVRPGTSRV